MKHIAIVGAGLMGRLSALSLARLGYQVSLFDKDTAKNESNAARVAAGLLTPLGESMCSEPWVVQMGFDSLQLWPDLLASLQKWVFFQHQGSVLLAHPQDSGDMQRFARHIDTHWPQYPSQWLNRQQLLELEPGIARTFQHGLYLPDEGQIGNRKLLKALRFELENPLSDQLKVDWRAGQNVTKVEPHQIEVNGDHLSFDLVIDCRGVGASSRLKDLRGVRGEVFQLYAPEVTLNRPVRLMHPRYHLYIAPKPNHHFVVGATEIESDDDGPMTVRSALELLSAVYSVHTGFAEAQIREQVTGCRPAFADNNPQIRYQAGLIEVNGLYRHGFLIAPVVLEHLVALVSEGANAEFGYAQLMRARGVN